MNIELREPGQVTRRGFLELAAKAVAALAVAGTVGKIVAEEAAGLVYRTTLNVAVRFEGPLGWVIGTSYKHPDGGTVFVASEHLAEAGSCEMMVPGKEL